MAKKSKIVNNTENLEETVKVFSALANEGRLKIYKSLLEGEKNVTTIHQNVGYPQAVISQGLYKLTQAGLITFQKQGQFSIYSVLPEWVDRIKNLI